MNEWNVGFFIPNLQLRNLWGGRSNISVGKSHEQGQHFTRVNINLNIYSPYTGDLSGGVWSWFGYGYNHNRGHFGWQGNVGTWTDYSLNPSFKVSLDTKSILEFRPDHTLEDVTFIATPRLSWNLTRDIELSSYLEAVATRTSKKIGRIRIGGLLKWRLAPKSWFYVALNDLEDQDLAGQRFVTAERLALVKLRYLVIFEGILPRGLHYTERKPVFFLISMENSVG